MKKEPKVKRKNRFQKEVVPKETDDLLTYIIYLRGSGPKDPNKPKTVKAKKLTEVVKYALENYGKERLLEVHDYRDNLLWGINTGLNEKVFVK
jgi:hypothetical protein